MLSDPLISQYQATRAPGVDRSVLCHAPYTSLNFDQNGRARVCCYNWRDLLGTYPEMTVAEMWRGAAAMVLRRSFLDGTEVPGCELCFDQLRGHNFAGALMKGFDDLSVDPGYRPELHPAAPRVIEFELSNVCNLECVMCQGKWSSAIRQNREQLPPLRSPYDDAFVDQLDEFLPGLARARFLGGEPLLIKLYHRIWERIQARNPEVAISITSNGTVIPEPAWDLLQGLDGHICLSIDAVSRETFERVRKHASFDQVMANFDRWREYTERRGTVLSLAVCPMIHNWRELPDLARFCERQQIPFYLNTVVRPYADSLANLAPDELDAIAGHLAAMPPGGGAGEWANNNRARWDSLIEQLRWWSHTKRGLETHTGELAGRVRSLARTAAASTPGLSADELSSVTDAVARRTLALTRTDLPGELRDRLVQMTPVSVHDSEQPAPPELLLPALIVCAHATVFAAAGEPSARGDAQLRRDLALALRSVHSRRAGELRDAVRKVWSLVEHGATGRIEQWLRDWLDTTEQSAAPDVARLSAVHSDNPCNGRFLEALTMAPGGDSSPGRPAPPAIDDDNLRDLLDAIGRYHRQCEPDADHETMRTRLAKVERVLLASRSRHAAYREADSAGPFALYMFLACASDDDFAGALRPYQQ